MISIRSRNISAAPIQTVFLAGAVCLCSIPALTQAPPERLSDESVKTLIEQVDEGRDKFEGNLDNQFKNSTLRGPNGETKVAGALQDYQDNTKKLKDRFTPDYSASAEAPLSSSSPRPSTRSCRVRRVPCRAAASGIRPERISSTWQNPTAQRSRFPTKPQSGEPTIRRPPPPPVRRHSRGPVQEGPRQRQDASEA